VHSKRGPLVVPIIDNDSSNVIPNGSPRVTGQLYLAVPVRGRSTERAARDFARLPGMRSRAASCQNEAYPTSPSRALPTTWAKKLGYSDRQRTFWDFRGTAVEQAMLER